MSQGASEFLLFFCSGCQRVGVGQLDRVVLGIWVEGGDSGGGGVVVLNIVVSSCMLHCRKGCSQKEGRCGVTLSEK